MQQQSLSQRVPREDGSFWRPRLTLMHFDFASPLVASNSVRRLVTFHSSCTCLGAPHGAVCQQIRQRRSPSGAAGRR